MNNSINDFFLLGMKRDIPNILPMDKGIVLNLGAGNQVIVDTHPLQYETGWNAETDAIPFIDESVDGIHAYHFLEHIQNIHFLMSECQRVMKKGAVMNI